MQYTAVIKSRAARQRGRGSVVDGSPRSFTGGCGCCALGTAASCPTDASFMALPTSSNTESYTSSSRLNKY
eukprot:5967359-Karenia_brevis.AAC.1